MNRQIFSCECCNFTTNKPSYWLKHTQSQKHQRYGEKKIHNCKFCEYSTRTSWNMKAHILSQHATKEERLKQKYYCNDCDRVFFSSLYMINHMNGKRHNNYIKALEELNKTNQMNINQQSTE